MMVKYHAPLPSFSSINWEYSSYVKHFCFRRPFVAVAYSNKSKNDGNYQPESWHSRK